MAGSSAGVSPTVHCQLVVRVCPLNYFSVERPRAGTRRLWQGFSPNHRLFLQFFVILLTSKLKLSASGQPLSPDQIIDTVLGVSSGHSLLPPTTPIRGLSQSPA